jgi:hypothetical protein
MSSLHVSVVFSNASLTVIVAGTGNNMPTGPNTQPQPLSSRSLRLCERNLFLA